MKLWKEAGIYASDMTKSQRAQSANRDKHILHVCQQLLPAAETLWTSWRTAGAIPLTSSSPLSEKRSEDAAVRSQITKIAAVRDQGWSLYPKEISRLRGPIYRTSRGHPLFRPTTLPTFMYLVPIGPVIKFKWPDTLNIPILTSLAFSVVLRLRRFLDCEQLLLHHASSNQD